jgi:dienelactone hydrolase
MRQPPASQPEPDGGRGRPGHAHGHLLGWILAGLAAIVVLAGLAVATIYFTMIDDPGFLSPKARQEHAQFIAAGLSVTTPPGPGPFPTVLLVPGCGGLRGDNGPNPIMDEYARSAVEAGWAAAILDSYGPRHWDASWARNRVCTGLRLPGFRRAADVLAGLDLLHADPRVDPHHLRIASWSHGGWTVGDLVTLSDPGDGSFRRTMADVEAVQFTYPYCAFPSQAGKRAWTWRGGVRFVFAQRDVVQPPAGCRAMEDRARAGGAQVESIVYPGVTHAFDERVQTPTSRFVFDPGAAARAHAEFIAWLKTPPAGR